MTHGGQGGNLGSKGNIFLVILLLVGILAALVGGYFWSNSKSQKPTEPAKVITSSADLSCQSDGDCRLVVKDSWSNCSVLGDCQPIDYSLDKWMAVNSLWYARTADQILKTCPLPMRDPRCYPKPINDNFEARCAQSVCQKVPKKEQSNTESSSCGGIAGLSCPSGFTCKLDGNYPDAGGRCLKTTPSDNIPKYSCPKGGWVGCMPAPNMSEENKNACTQEAIKWYKENCPDYQGVAY